MNLFAAAQVADLPVERMMGRLIPFVLVVVACLAIVTYLPGVSLFLRDVAF